MSLVRRDPRRAVTEDAAGAQSGLPAGTFEIVARAPLGPARSCRLWTAHGSVETPCFMPVGTYGAVKGMDPAEVDRVGSQIILGNSYHLAHRPGFERLRRLGGLHAFMGWSKPILTDSGGYQVYSLSGFQKVSDEGVTYRTHFDGSLHQMTPRSVLEVQAAIGSDICMVLDECPPGEAPREVLVRACERTTRWAVQQAELRGSILGASQLCFGIVQGGTDLELRRWHLEQITALSFDGFALGGLSVGEPIPAMHATMAEIAPLLPEARPRYVMGIGTPLDLLAAVESGVDMFDCVIPTRHARNGQVFTFDGRLNLRGSRFREDAGPIDPDCGCSTCQRFSRAYLRHLFDQNDPLFGRLATLHNLYFFHEWVALLRGAIRSGSFLEVARSLRARLLASETASAGAVARA